MAKGKTSAIEVGDDRVLVVSVVEVDNPRAAASLAKTGDLP
jgi:hypothetical protein